MEAVSSSETACRERGASSWFRFPCNTRSSSMKSKIHLLLLLPIAFAAAGFSGRAAGPVPPILFVSRNRPSDPAQIPGMGPHGRFVAPGGELMKRERSGRVRSFLPFGRFFDVSDPDVSWDGRSV